MALRKDTVTIESTETHHRDQKPSPTSSIKKTSIPINLPIIKGGSLQKLNT